MLTAQPNFVTGAQSQLVAPEFAPDADLVAVLGLMPVTEEEPLP